MVIDKNQAAIEMWAQALEHTERSNPQSLDWARSVSASTFKKLTSTMFLRDYCYVVYASGFKASTVQKHFSSLTEAFRDFDLDEVASMRSGKKALKIISSKRKARNFLTGAKLIAEEGFGVFKQRLALGGPDVLEELPGIGPITKFHLAKNIGLADVAKPDIWLVRAAKRCGFADVDEFVQFLHEHTGESRHVADVVIWTFGKDGGLQTGSANHG